MLPPSPAYFPAPQTPPHLPSPHSDATANVSGGHLNPAVTLGTIISGHMHWKRGLAYMAAQFLGGIAGRQLKPELGAGKAESTGDRTAHSPTWHHGSLECCARISKALKLPPLPAGVLFQCALIPDASIGMGNEGPGCFTHLGGQYIRKDQVGPWRCQAGWAAGPYRASCGLQRQPCCACRPIFRLAAALH